MIHPTEFDDEENTGVIQVKAIIAREQATEAGRRLETALELVVKEIRASQRPPKPVAGSPEPEKEKPKK